MRGHVCNFIHFITNAIGCIPLVMLRKILYTKCLKMKIGSKSYVYRGAMIRWPWKIEIGNNTIIGDHAILDGLYQLKIGNNVNLSTGVWIWTAQHDKNSPYFDIVGGPVVIEDYVWISCRTVILPNVTIGKGAVVCAGAVVTKDVTPFTVVAGVPAKEIGIRNDNLQYNLGGSISFL